MTNIIRFTWCCVLLFSLFSTRPAAAAHYDLYVLAGQSNMDGRGAVKDLVGELASYAGPQPNAVIWYSNGSFRRYDGRSRGWEPLRPGFAVPPGIAVTTTSASTSPAAPRTAYPLPGPYFGPELGFAKAMRDANPAGPSIAVMKFSVSGANLRREWNADRRKLIYDEFVASYRDAVAALNANGDTATPRAFLWHQGESDAQLPPAEYEQLLQGLIARVRQDLGDAALPIVLGEPFDNGKRLSIRIAQRSTAKALPNVYCVSSIGLKTGDRDTHFDAASQIELGRRFAESILKKADAGPVPPMTMPTSRQVDRDAK